MVSALSRVVKLGVDLEVLRVHDGVRPRVETRLLLDTDWADDVLRRMQRRRRWWGGGGR
jgi:hypothetical protein